LPEHFLSPLRRAAVRGELRHVRSDVLAELVGCRDHLAVLKLGVRLGLEAAAVLTDTREQLAQIEQIDPTAVIRRTDHSGPRGS